MDVREKYLGGYGKEVLAVLSKRRAGKEGAFFIPHLRKGMSVLDCGCGPGTMTVDFAEIVSPGEVAGIDIEDSQFALGRKWAEERKLTNVSFIKGSIYELDFPDETFNAVFVHAVLYHLKDPLDALKDIYRVLKPGGFVGLRDYDEKGNIFYPSTPVLEKWMEISHKLIVLSGGNPAFGRTHRALLHQTGFKNIETSASFDYFKTLEEIRKLIKNREESLQRSEILDIAVKQGWLREEEKQELFQGIKGWSSHPDLFFARARCEAVGWK